MHQVLYPGLPAMPQASQLGFERWTLIFFIFFFHFFFIFFYLFIHNARELELLKLTDIFLF